MRQYKHQAREVFSPHCPSFISSVWPPLSSQSQAGYLYELQQEMENI
jgi:hypothetical protein